MWSSGSAGAPARFHIGEGCSHRLIGDERAEIGQGADNAVVSPTGVLSGEADNEGLHYKEWIIGRTGHSIYRFGQAEPGTASIGSARPGARSSPRHLVANNPNVNT